MDINESYISNMQGDGWIEEYSIIRGKVKDRFYIGAYTKIEDGAECLNTFIGRFSIIEKNCFIGYPKIKSNAFSNNYDFFYKNTEEYNISKYHRDIMSKSRYFFEQDPYTFIGNDVLIGANSVIVEGVSIGDGVRVMPNSFVDFDVPDFAIVQGNKIISFRYNKNIISKIKSINWWDKDIYTPIRSFLERDSMARNITSKSIYLDWISNTEDYLLYLYEIKDKLSNLDIKRFYRNYLGSFCTDNVSRVIIGPSHVKLWFEKYKKGKLVKPNCCHLLPIKAVSSFSENLEKLIIFTLKYFGKIILFVPDFRIGNSAAYALNKDSIYINVRSMNYHTDNKCYQLALDALNRYQHICNSNIKFWFWCLWGRENFDRIIRGKDKGHPIWNYKDVISKYKDNTLDVNEYFKNTEIGNIVTDASIHPTDSSYIRMADIFDKVNFDD